MSKTVIAIATVALLATSGIASAKTVRQPAPSADPAAASAPLDRSEAAFRTNPFQASWGHIGGNNNVTSYNHPGDNDMDPVSED